MSKKEIKHVAQPPLKEAQTEPETPASSNLSEVQEVAANQLFHDQNFAGFDSALDLRQISHDLNNYLTILMIHCDELQESLSATEKRRTHFELLHDNLKLAASIVKELSFPAETKPATLMSSQAFFAFLHEQKAVWTLLTGGAMQIDLSLSVKLDDTVFVRIIQNYAKRACMQIVRNAAEAIFTDAGPDTIDKDLPCLSVWLKSDGTLLWLHFQDNGPGVLNNLVGHLFEAGATSHDNQFRGYGLRSARKLVHLWGGELRYHHSDDTAAGAHFSMSFPLQT